MKESYQVSRFLFRKHFYWFLRTPVMPTHRLNAKRSTAGLKYKIPTVDIRSCSM